MVIAFSAPKGRHNIGRACSDSGTPVHKMPIISSAPEGRHSGMFVSPLRGLGICPETFPRGFAIAPHPGYDMSPIKGFVAVHQKMTVADAAHVIFSLCPLSPLGSLCSLYKKISKNSLAARRVITPVPELR